MPDSESEFFYFPVLHVAPCIKRPLHQKKKKTCTQKQLYGRKSTIISPRFVFFFSKANIHYSLVSPPAIYHCVYYVIVINCSVRVYAKR